jgi:hypothetical protein
MAVVPQPVATRLSVLNTSKKTPGHKARALKLEACFFVAYFVAGAGVAVLAAAGLVLFLLFLCFFAVAVEAVVAVVVVVVVAVVVVAVDAFVPAALSSANATPSERSATATRAESVFFIFLPPSPASVAGSGATDGTLSATPLPAARPDFAKAEKLFPENELEVADRPMTCPPRGAAARLRAVARR